MFPEDVKCRVCGNTTECMFIGSTNTMGPPDLDLRPAEMARSNIGAWVHRCPTCGNCAGDLSKKRKGAKTLVKSKDYTHQLSHPDYPELANSFLCHAMLAEKDGDLASATYALIYAAWACDDKNATDAASACRLRAAAMLEACEADGQLLFDGGGAGTAVLVDLLRRAGEPDKAREVIASRRGRIDDEDIRAVLDFQLRLIESGDTACHTTAEAFPGEE
jgi:hypothetical protein